MKELASDFLSMVFPDACHGCRQVLTKGETVICTNCRTLMLPIDMNSMVHHTIRARFEGQVPFEYILSAFKFVKHGSIQQMLHELKYNKAKEVGEVLGRWYGEELYKANLVQSFDVMIPVPLHSSREKKRGYNQAHIFATGIADMVPILALPNAVKRIKPTASQTKFSNAVRWQNVDGIFKVMSPDLITGKRVLLVDDIVTTGATITSLANEVLKYHPISISLVVIAMAD